jgi:hypothetical protein
VGHGGTPHGNGTDGKDGVFETIPNTIRNTIRTIAREPENDYWGGWPAPVTAERLASPAAVEALFRHAVERWRLLPTARLAFHAAARSVIRRHAAGQIQNCGGAFTAIVKRRLWSHASLADEDFARSVIAELDRKAAGPCEPSIAAAIRTVAEALPVVPAPPGASDTTRARQIAALKHWQATRRGG